MIDCHTDFIDFYKDAVRLTDGERESLETARDTCANNVRNGLERNKEPSPLRFVSQGSFAMKSVVRHEAFEYDIDHGVVFDKYALVGPKGADKAPRAARQMVADAFKDKRFDSDPLVKKNCVRFPYAKGYHVDMPVYRTYKDIWGSTKFEIASGDDWKASSPEAVTKWFSEAVKAQSPDMSVDGQLRRIVCLLKAVEKTREYYNWPSGFIVSVLARDNYVADAHDDVAFVSTVRGIVSRLKFSTAVRHPVVDERLADESDSKVSWMRDKLSDFEKHFALLEDDCPRGKAMETWDKVFGTDWFHKRNVEKAALRGVATAVVTSAGSFRRPPDGGRWGVSSLR